MVKQLRHITFDYASPPPSHLSCRQPVVLCTLQNPEHLLVFAAGNLGDDMLGCSIASPAVGKNCLAVGSSMSGAVRFSTGDMNEVSDFSSKGPTEDGRIKPDVVAPGHFVSEGGRFLVIREGVCSGRWVWLAFELMTVAVVTLGEKFGVWRPH